ALLSTLAPSDLGRPAAAAILSDFLLATLAFLLLQFRVPSALRIVLVLCAAWLLPTVSAGERALARGAAVLDAGAVLRAPLPVSRARPDPAAPAPAPAGPSPPTCVDLPRR